MGYFYFFKIYYDGSTILAVSFENSKAIRIDFDVVYQNGCPPFHHACWNGILWTYQIRIWIDFYGVDCDGNTPLHFASMEGQRDIVIKFLKTLSFGHYFSLVKDIVLRSSYPLYFILCGNRGYRKKKKRIFDVEIEDIDFTTYPLYPFYILISSISICR